MSKNKGFSKGGGGGGMSGFNPAALQKQVEELQKKMLEAQQQLENESVSATVGGGMVTVTMNGHQKIQSIKINPDAIKESADDPTMLEDLLMAAVNEAHERSQTMASQRMNSVTGGLGVGLPGLG
jgi:DNA-binding YbaB/EbfC family protein